MFVNRAQQVVGQMAAQLNGVDCLVFTGTVGERSYIIRQRILEKLTYLGFAVDGKLNERTIEPTEIGKIHLRTRNKPIYVIHCDEASEIARRALALS
jgi:acetate kinase